MAHKSEVEDQNMKVTYIYTNSIFLQHFKEVLLNILENKIQSTFPLECLLERDYILVFEHTQHADFPHDGLLGDFIVVRLLEFLDSD